MPVIRKFLDLSTGHLSEQDKELLCCWVPVVHDLEHGWFVWVPPNNEHLEVPDGCSANVQKIIDYARSLECDHILFDADGPVDDALDYFENEEEEIETA